MSKPIADGWRSYRELVIPTEASATQLTESKQAFYAGATLLFTTMMRSLSKDDSEATPADLQFLDAIQAEIDAFGQEIDQRYIKSQLWKE